MSGQWAPTIPISHLTTDERYQARGDGLSETHLRLLMESNPQDWPPVIVSPDGDGSYGVRDGHHRTEAARRLGLSVLRCNVVKGAGYPEAVAANLAHGLPLSMRDRKDAARWWAETEPDLSYREIGRRVGLSDKTVKRAIEQDTADAPQPRPEPDPVARLVSQMLRMCDNGKPSRRTIRREIETYDDESRAGVADALTDLGRVLVDAATPYVEGR